jgi:hypothetical protein
MAILLAARRSFLRLVIIVGFSESDPPTPPNFSAAS